MAMATYPQAWRGHRPACEEDNVHARMQTRIGETAPVGAGRKMHHGKNTTMHTCPESDCAILDGAATDETAETAAVVANSTWLNTVETDAVPIASSDDTVNVPVSTAGMT